MVGVLFLPVIVKIGGKIGKHRALIFVGFGVFSDTAALFAR